MALTQIQAVVGKHPLPEPGRHGRPAVQKDTMFTLLGTMEVGGDTVDVNRSKRSVQGYIQRFRVQIDPSTQFVIRALQNGWTRVWRVK